MYAYLATSMTVRRARHLGRSGQPPSGSLSFAGVGRLDGVDRPLRCNPAEGPGPIAGQ